MQAWQYVGAGTPITLNDVPEPVAGPEDVKIAVHAVGLCHSDVGILEGVIPEWLLGSVPQTLGHEVAGVVTEVGNQVTSFAVGDRVAFHMGADGPGMGRPGGYAPAAVLPAAQVAPVPDSVTLPVAAAGTDSGMTPYHAVVAIGRVKAGDRVGIIGVGGLGSNAVQIARALGASVFAAEPRAAGRELATELGAEEVFEDVSGFSGLGLDVILDFAGFGDTTAGAVLAVKPGGRVVLVGVGRNETTLSTPLFIQNEVQLVGSAGGTLEDLQGYFDLVASGKVVPKISTTTFDKIGEGLERVAAGEVQGRLVAVLQD